MNKKKTTYDFEDLFVFELANNHQGDVKHGLSIIDMCSDVAKKYNIRAAIKIQLRQLETFIHPNYREADDPSHIKRFLSTQLTNEQFHILIDHARDKNLITMATPFDEESVDLMEEMNFEITKIGSCSANDWPLLEKVSEKNNPVIISTGGLNISDIDKIVSFCDHRGLDFALNHCVSVYPTPPNLCELNQIEVMRSRYPGITIGWSTHEDPNDSDIIMVAYAKGARIFEKHVGYINKKVPSLNAYSAERSQIEKWIEKYLKAKELCGSDKNPERDAEEIQSLNSLRRGVYALENIEDGEEITKDKVFFAMPYQKGQLYSGIWQENISSKKSFCKNEPLKMSALKIPAPPNELIIRHSLHEIKAMLNHANIKLGPNFQVEYSHHYGIDNFRKVGAIFITIVNRSYCKKLVVQLPGQTHPAHFHKKKEETFSVLSGVLEVTIDGYEQKLNPGEQALVQPGIWHSFSTDTGVIFEELSSTHFNDDSFYKDKKINSGSRTHRKTYTDNWGRFTLEDKISIQ